MNEPSQVELTQILLLVVFLKCVLLFVYVCLKSCPFFITSLCGRHTREQMQKQKHYHNKCPLITSEEIKKSAARLLCAWATPWLISRQATVRQSRLHSAAATPFIFFSCLAAYSSSKPIPIWVFTVLNPPLISVKEQVVHHILSWIGFAAWEIYHSSCGKMMSDIYSSCTFYLLLPFLQILIFSDSIGIPHHLSKE